MTATAIQSIDWDAFYSELSGIEIISDRAQVVKLSQDYYHFSPVLQPLLSDKTGDLVVRPASEAEVLRIAAACVKSQIPLTVRGAGTGNYGQCIPLKGGVILDTSKMNSIRWIKPGLACVEPGVKMSVFDKQARETGWELRMLPSTYRTATIGGFIGGGSGGIGSITYGQLRDRGNLHAVRVVTMEDEPRVIELRGDEVQKVNHAYGTNGIITELEIPLAPAYAWAEIIVAFDDFMRSANFGQALGDADGIIKKLICVCAWPIPAYFAAFRDAIPEGKHCALLMVAESCLEPLQDLVREYGGTICYQKNAAAASKGAAIAEFTWNHTTLHARSADPSLTYLQTLFPPDKGLKLIEELYNYYGDEVIMHLEFLRMNGRAIAAALQIVRYTTESRLNEIIRYHEEQGALIANPHTYILEDGGMKSINVEQLQFKELVDPYGLLNPGKMRAWLERD
ncbi:FAD linked oxidase domain protein [Oscillatoria nigro-viridis PCC 7112]|uniref:FAD linked oxidase domain protein n=1 Tax=Phormidium nigroviride PCC 7112 TaxID=179408 RepID=K9VE57_9CYAN|nr:FAD-binding oxidoreductase [Oscillatoria nigro-viridis]AFZ06211.1 FAD linked oxidase domain protein [Oscillatoria nigro-viridis PCC 7112]